MSEQARALLIYSALLLGVGGGGGFAGGRMSAPVPPAEVRIVTIPAPPAVVIPPEATLVEPVVPVPLPKVERDETAVSPPVEVKPSPPKIDARPKAVIKPQAKPEAKPRAPAPKKSLPSCAVVKREYQTMSWAQQMAAYHRATAEEIAHGKRCLGF